MEFCLAGGGLPEAPVGALPGEKFFALALLDQAALFQHQDPVGPVGRVQPVRDQQRRRTTHQFPQHSQQLFLRGRIQCARRLVQKQNRRIPQNARAIPILCRCPPLNITPLSPTCVS